MAALLNEHYKDCINFVTLQLRSYRPIDVLIGNKLIDIGHFYWPCSGLIGEVSNANIKYF